MPRRSTYMSKKSKLLKEMSERAGVRHQRQLQIKSDQEKLSQSAFEFDYPISNQ